MQVEWAFTGSRVAGHEAVLDRYSVQEFDSPTRSTIPLLAYWRSPEERLRELTPALGLPLPGRVELNFEHTVYPPRGRGKASCTDVMVIAAEFVLAIEAKWTERRDKTVGDWLNDSSNPSNRAKVLRGWCDLLEQRGVNPIRECDIRGMPYQMIHRAASACHPRGDATNRWLVYLLFETTQRNRSEHLDDLARLRDLLGARSTLEIGLIECSIEPSPALGELRRRWDTGERHLHEPVLQHLKCGELLRARLDRVHRLSV